MAMTVRPIEYAKIKDQITAFMAEEVDWPKLEITNSDTGELPSFKVTTRKVKVSELLRDSYDSPAYDFLQILNIAEKTLISQTVAAIKNIDPSVNLEPLLQFYDGYPRLEALSLELNELRLQHSTQQLAASESQARKLKPDPRIDRLEHIIGRLPSKSVAMDRVINSYDEELRVYLKIIKTSILMRDSLEEKLKYVKNVGKRANFYLKHCDESPQSIMVKPILTDNLRSMAANNERISGIADIAEAIAYGGDGGRDESHPMSSLQQCNKALHEQASETLRAIQIRVRKILDIDYEHFAELDKTSSTPLRPQPKPGKGIE